MVLHFHVLTKNQLAFQLIVLNDQRLLESPRMGFYSLVNNVTPHILYLEV